MSEIFARNELVWGKDFQNLLSQKHLAIFGLGGVGGYAAESLARSGVGELTLIDFDTVSESNINRQLVALNSTIGKNKAQLFKQRLLDINPNLKINLFDAFYTKELNESVFNKNIDFVIDAIDTLKSKIQLLEYCHSKNIKIITSMGAGNRMDPTKLQIKDISEIGKTKCTFSNNIIRILDKKNIKVGITCVTSDEKPARQVGIKNQEKILTSSGEEIILTKISPGSTPFVPPVVGYYMAFFAIDSFIKDSH